MKVINIVNPESNDKIANLQKFKMYVIIVKECNYFWFQDKTYRTREQDKVQDYKK